MKQKFTLVLVVAACCCLKFNNAKAQVNVQDSLALVDLYNSTNGPGWYDHTNWLTSAPVSTWAGIYVSGSNITQLNLFGNNLSGKLPSSLGNFSELTYLELGGNKLIGAIPSTVSNLTNLENLFLGANQLSGSIPSSLGKVVKISALNLSQNKLTGNIPSSLGNLINLTTLEIDDNQLTGNIPSSFRKLVNISYLSLAGNQLTGNISFLSGLDSLHYLVLISNQLNGNLSALSKLTHLDYIDLAYNQFSGNIPVFRKLNVSFFDLAHNQLSGIINNQFDSLSSNTDLILNNNYLTGNIPLNKLAHLNSIDLSYNKLNGKILPANDSSFNLTSLEVSHNYLTGNIPSSLGNLTNLKLLDLSSNQINGIIPSSLTKLTHLFKVYLDSNQFTFAGMENIATAFPFAVYSPQANINIQQNGNVLSVAAGGSISNNTYHWYKDGVLYKTKTGKSSLSITAPGNYSVSVTNSIATALTLYSDTVYYLMAPNSITVEVNNESKILKAQVYPNPATTNATVSFYADGKYSITVTDVSGKILQTKNGIASKGMNFIQFDLSRYPSGMYLVTINNKANKPQTIKLNKE